MHPEPQKNLKFTVTTEPLTRKARSSGPRQFRPMLICLEGTQAGMRFLLTEPETTIGRNLGNHIAVHDDMISRYHAVIHYENFIEATQRPICFLKDLDSLNGTELNGHVIDTTKPLCEGDRIILGSTTFGFFVRDEEEFLSDQMLYQMATHDALTGLMNRHQFLTLLGHHVERSHRREQPTALLIVDIDKFKYINDQHGHDVGDKVLMHVAELLVSTCRSSDLCARWGGDEFLLLMPDSDKPVARATAERIRLEAAATPFIIEGLTIHLTISVGLALLEKEQTINDFFRSADQQLLRAKGEGRNRVCE
jgi:diguanylate cyclase (GGDEF)-like protein